MSEAALHHEAGDTFRHGAFLYRDDDELVTRASAFLLRGLELGQPAFAMMGGLKIKALRDHLGSDADSVHFVDLASIGANPARIIPIWQELVAKHSRDGCRLRGIGEPIRVGRNHAELVEWQRHESLLNVAFGGSPGWWLLCAYDVTRLPSDVIEEVERSHEYVLDHGVATVNANFRSGSQGGMPFDAPPLDPAGPTPELSFGDGSLAEVRACAASGAVAAGFGNTEVTDFVLAVSEVATNSVRHGGGRGTMRIWCDESALVCEVSDSGCVDDPLAGRRMPSPDRHTGRGLWLANQLCDLVQMHSCPTGTVVRLYLWRD